MNAETIAAPLRRAAEAGDVPGVVAAAANADGVIFEGGFGTRDLATGAPMTADTVVWIASMTKAVTGACAMQLVEQGKLSLDGEIAGVVPELAGCRCWKASTPRASRACARRSAPSRCATCSRTPPASLRHVECRHGRYHGSDRHPRHHHLPQRRAGPAAGVRSRREMGIRHRHRLGRQGGGGGLRPDARPVHARQHPRPARHDRHRVPHR